jgi:threonyl-tRNA synthetase
MAEAICDLFPETQLVYGPPVENGFYYDIDLDRPITPEDFEKIEARMKEIVAESRPFTRYELSRAEGVKKLQAEGNRYKIGNAEAAKGDVLSFYVTGDTPGEYFEDLCAGPHVPDTSYIKAFKLMNVAGAYYHGDVNEKMLQRIYGTAWPSPKALRAYLQQLEEAKKRDHRTIGKQLSLFTISDKVGQGLVLWMPKGATVRYQLEDFIRGELVKRGYDPVYTPHIGRLDLYRTSGHFPYYKDSQYPPIGSESDEGDGYLLKPMNCPHHIQIFDAEPHSYRELPVRLAEFGTVYRYEQSGELSGMTRVRGFTQDDAHIFCTDEQLESELADTVDLVQFVLDRLGLTDYRVRAGFRDPTSDKYAGTDTNWDQAQSNIRNVVGRLGLNATEEPGEAAFYGPKIDFVVKDCLGREWQLGTVQVDYNLPERFDLSYVGADNQAHRPIMIHRAPFGSFERFVGILIEHFAGAFPFWLAPVQMVVATISEKVDAYAQLVHDRLFDAGLRPELDRSSEKINAKIRRAAQQKVPYILVVGEQEAESDAVNVRRRGGDRLGSMPLDAFIAERRQDVASRALTP